ncbi:tRNA 2-thiouridine(34) synthase MnmA [bacterium]|nr:tRNA 2-thiouridine(34) synthase MnmA [bacterium]
MNKELNSIGINKKPSETTVVVAMSGGVDSSTVAGIMKNEGYKVIGITLKLYDDGKEIAKSKQCCSGQDIMDAKRVAHKLDIEHKILYYQDKFKQGVIDNFVDSYLNGETPIPCVQCNQTVKFKDLFEVSKDLNADALVTGHYVKNITANNTNNMYRAIDENRDQSYFLFNTTREQLDYLRFPLGGMLKDKTREIAKELDLNVANKPDSQDICFVPNGDYASVIRKFRPDSFQKGNIKNLDGKVIGVHDGIINFTIGQRKGIKVSDKEPLYVLKINSDKNEIIVGAKENLGKKNIFLKDLNLLTDKKDLDKNIYVKVRSTGNLLEAKVDLKDNNNAQVNLIKPEDGISPGQACVFYNKDQFGFKVLGGGWIYN